jgi:hypothetical protein
VYSAKEYKAARRNTGIIPNHGISGLVFRNNNQNNQIVVGMAGAKDDFKNRRQTVDPKMLTLQVFIGCHKKCKKLKSWFQAVRRIKLLVAYICAINCVENILNLF